MGDETPVDTEQKPSMFSRFTSFFTSKKKPHNTVPPNTSPPNPTQPNKVEPKVGGRGRRRKSLRRRRHIKSTHHRRKY
jgi:hypothetical protein